MRTCAKDNVHSFKDRLPSGHSVAAACAVVEKVMSSLFVCIITLAQQCRYNTVRTQT